jgi:hypothetical protein
MPMSPGERHLLFVVGLLDSCGSPSTSIRPSGPSDSVYDDLVRVLRETVEEDAVLPASSRLSGTIECELPGRGDRRFHVDVREGEVVIVPLDPPAEAEPD